MASNVLKKFNIKNTDFVEIMACANLLALKVANYTKRFTNLSLQLIKLVQTFYC
jgi:hypothetical protein